MRKLLLLVVVLVVLGLAAPFGMGWYGERQIQRLAAQIPTSSNVQISIENYQRGWFTSNAQFKVTLRHMGSARKTAAKEVVLISQEKIIHGPIIWDSERKRPVFALALINSTLNIAPELEQQWQQKFSGKVPPIQARSVLTYMGAMQSTVKSPAFSLTSKQPEAGTLAWQGLTVSADMSANGDELTGSIDFAGMSLNNADTQLQLGAVKLNYQEQQTAIGLWVGKANLELPSLTLNTQGKERINLKNFSFSTDSNVKDDVFNANSHAKLESLRIEDANYGPGEYAMQVQNINAQALTQLQQQLKSSRNASLSKQQRQALLFTMLPLWPTLLDKGPEIKLQTLSLVTPDGKASMHGVVRIPRDKTTAESDAGKASPQALLQQLQVDMNIDLPIKLTTHMISNVYFDVALRRQRFAQAQYAQQKKADPKAKAPEILSVEQLRQQAEQAATQQIQQWVDSGMLIVAGDVHKIHVTVKQQKLLINGKDPKQAPKPAAEAAKSTVKPIAKPAAKPVAKVTPQ